MTKIFKSIYTYFKETDKVLLICSLLCAVLGILMVNSATMVTGSNRNVIIQIIAALIGIVLMVVFSSVSYQIWDRFPRILFCVGCALLIITLIFASTVSGSKSWIRIFGISVQLSEFVKIIFVLTFSSHLAAVGDDINKIKHILLLLGHLMVYVLLVYLQGDMGTAIVFFVMGISMLFVAGLSWKYFLAFGISLVPIGFILYKFILDEYQIRRILVIFDPDLDPLNYGWQTLRTTTAIGSGKAVGQGYGQGLMTQRGLIPAIENDSIFAVIGEELGFVGSILVLILFTILLIRILRVSFYAKDTAGTYICIGIFGMLAFQVIENIGMSLGLLPIIGITLPFFSAGGSSMITVFAGIGLVMSVYRNKTFFD